MAVGFVARDHHHNRRGIVQGGMLATLAERAMGMSARRTNGNRLQTTEQLDMHYMDAAQIGEFIVAPCEVVRVTKSLIFVKGRLTAEERLIVTAKGI